MLLLTFSTVLISFLPSRIHRNIVTFMNFLVLMISYFLFLLMISFFSLSLFPLFLPFFLLLF